MNTDSKTLAYINMFAVLGRLRELSDLSAEAKLLLPESPLTLRLRVRNGPEMGLRFDRAKCSISRQNTGDIILPFPDCEKFNRMIDGTYTPVPRKGFTKIKFLTNQFKELTDLLTKYLRPEPERLKDESFFKDSTTLMFYVIAHALAEVGNHDEIGRYSASEIEDGTMRLSIMGGPSECIAIGHHELSVVEGAPEKVHAVMEFANLKTARAVFDGELNAKTCIGTGQIALRGRLGMIDNMNRILDRVALYLA